MDEGDLVQGEGGVDDLLEGGEVEGVGENQGQDVTGLNDKLWVEVQQGLQEVQILLSGGSNGSGSQQPGSEDAGGGARGSFAKALAGKLIAPR